MKRGAPDGGVADGTACGVEGLTRYDEGLPAGVLPGLNVVAAVHSAATGIVVGVTRARATRAVIPETTLVATRGRTARAGRAKAS